MRIETVFERIVTLAIEWKLANLQPQIAACRNLLHTRNGIDVAVLGRFKAGKSSFLNHLTGRDVLPIGVVPLTAVITRLRYQGKERAEVRFLDGTTKTIPLGEISSFVGENENPKNLKQVAAVEIGLPELNPLAPLQFVDTPGLGSAFAHNTETALNWLPNISTCSFPPAAHWTARRIFSATSPGNSPSARNFSIRLAVRFGSRRRRKVTGRFDRAP